MYFAFVESHVFMFQLQGQGLSEESSPRIDVHSGITSSDTSARIITHTLHFQHFLVWLLLNPTDVLFPLDANVFCPGSNCTTFLLRNFLP